LSQKPEATEFHRNKINTYQKEKRSGFFAIFLTMTVTRNNTRSPLPDSAIFFHPRPHMQLYAFHKKRLRRKNLLSLGLHNRSRAASSQLAGECRPAQKKRPSRSDLTAFDCMVEGTPTYRKTVSKPALLVTP